MDIRKYVADSMAKGLIQVREELGADAMIVKVEETPGVLGSKKVEIYAKAAEGSAPEQSASPSAPASVRPGVASKGKSFSEAELLERMYAEQARLTGATPPGGAAQAQVQPEPEAPKKPTRRPSSSRSVRAMAARARARTQKTENVHSERVEMPEADLGMRPGMVFGGESRNDLPPQAASLYFYLTDTGVQPDIADEMVTRISQRMDPHRPWDKRRVREFLGGMVNRQIVTGGQLRNIRKKRIAALIGPTGVGKTTTIAKLATRLVRNGYTVGLITIDHFRVGAIDQLKKFADTMHVPVLAASSKRDFQTSLRAFHSRQVVLIDTAGQNPRDMELMERLNQTLAVGQNIERHLVLSAPTKERDLAAYAELYQHMNYDYLLFSKLDETSTYGGLLNTYFVADRPYSYFTTGQRVPEDLEEASAELLNDLLFH